MDKETIETIIIMNNNYNYVVYEFLFKLISRLLNKKRIDEFVELGKLHFSD